MLYLVLYAEYQPNGRREHTSNVAGNNLYVWSGSQKDYPRVHNDEAKRKYNSHVEVLNLTTGNWRQFPTTGRSNPPLGVTGYASAVIDNNIIYFGGFCGHEGCYHNSVTALCVDTLSWKELSPTNAHTGPMMKCYCGVVAVKIEGKNYLLVIGGHGPLVNTLQQDTAEYIKLTDINFLTNEQHYFDLSSGKYTCINQ